MHAVRVGGPSDVAVTDVPAPQPGPGELLVRVEAAGLCSTDRKMVARGSDQPRVPGHEIAGRLQDGTLVGVHPEVTCGECAACVAGWENRCPERVSLGLGRDGGLAAELAVPAGQVLPLADLDPATGAMLEPLACVVQAMVMADSPADVPAVVVGAGAMGTLAMWVLQSRGCRVVMGQRSPRRRALALQAGAEAVIAPGDDPQPYLGGPPRVVFVSAPDAAALHWALEVVAPGGWVHAFAGIPGEARVDANLVHYRHLRLVGSTGSRMQDYRQAYELVTSDAVRPADLPHQVVRMDDVPRILAADQPAGVLKTIVAVGTAASTDS